MLIKSYDLLSIAYIESKIKFNGGFVNKFTRSPKYNPLM